MKTIYLAGGCFWGLEKYFSLVPGVKTTEVGYANGKTANPTYEQVCGEDAGHAETVKITYDEGAIDLGLLLEKFFDAIDPTSVNRQGPDVGVQYRSGIYYTDEADREVIARAFEDLRQRVDGPIAVAVEPLANYFRAEEYHQDYLDKNPGGYCHIGPDRMAKAKGTPARSRPKSGEEQ